MQGPEPSGADFATRNGRDEVKFILGDYPADVRQLIHDGKIYGTVDQDPYPQAYNAMRNAVTKTARSVAVEYQTDNKLTNQQIADLGLAIGSTTPYLLKADDLQVEVTVPATQSFTTARELELTMTYQMPSFLDFAGISGPSVTYSRALFVITS